jgi:hypothetical protein
MEISLKTENPSHDGTIWWGRGGVFAWLPPSMVFILPSEWVSDREIGYQIFWKKL